jgi:ABC-2 type transport system permease protein
MKKFLAVVRREYVQRVRSRMFLVVTIGAPVLFALFTAMPVLIAGIRTGGPLRVAVFDESGKVYERLRDSVASGQGKDDADDAAAGEGAQAALNQNGRDRMAAAAKASERAYNVERVEPAGRTAQEVKRQLDERVKKDELDAYLMLPADVLDGGEAQYYSRNVSDMFARGQIKDALTRAVRDARLDENGIRPEVMRAVNRPVKMSSAKAGAGGGGEDKGEGFFLVYGVGFVIYMTILLYGQVILGAVIEEKETRIAEILFSSIRSFPLMVGKIIGVSLVAMTQFAIWGIGLAGLTAYLAGQGAAAAGVPRVPAGVFAYLILFFLLGYFIYAALYALVGSMVTTAQEGGQLAMPIIFMLIAGFLLVIPIIRSPNSSFAFWVSMVPFFAPITMLVRVVTQTPPLWQIALSLALGFATVVLLMWLASRVYRVGMLMYGKRATIPEVLKWVRQP